MPEFLRVPHEFNEGSGSASRFALIVGAGAAGLAFAQALLRQRPSEDWRVSLTRRTSIAVKQLRDQLARDGLLGRGLAIYPLDPTDEQSVAHLGAVIGGHGKIDLLVLASGQAILDTSCSNEFDYFYRNMAANFQTKVAVFKALQEHRHLDVGAKVIVVSSRVVEFDRNAPEVSSQQGYRASIAALEGWAASEAVRFRGVVEFHISRMPLIMSPTADVYREQGVVPADYPLVDPLLYAVDELQKVFSSPA